MYEFASKSRTLNHSETINTSDQSDFYLYDVV